VEQKKAVEQENFANIQQKEEEEHKES